MKSESGVFLAGVEEHKSDQWWNMVKMKTIHLYETHTDPIQVDSTQPRVPLCGPRDFRNLITFHTSIKITPCEQTMCASCMRSCV